MHDVPVRGSERDLPAGFQESGPVDTEEQIDVTVVVRPQAKQISPEEVGRVPFTERSYPSREEYWNSQGSTAEDLKKVQDFAQKHHLNIVEVSAPRRSVILRGTAAHMSAAFSVKLKSYHGPDGKEYRIRTGPVFVPEELSAIVQTVLGLDNRPQAKSHFRIGQSQISSYTPPELAKLYDFPTKLDGTGECIGIIELGGGDTPNDLNDYFKSLGITAPKITTISVDGAANSPTGDPSGPDGEVMLDIEVAGSIAPGAKIAIYFAPNTDRGFHDALTTAIHDSQNKPSVISISCGSPENSWTAQAIQAFNQAFQDAAALGVTVCVAAGDGGSSDGESDGLAHVDFPASSPFALACGGTRLLSSGGKITSESVWNDGHGGGATGGGVSDLYPLPTWQNGANVPPSVNPDRHVGRGIPDVCGDADPATGYTVRVDGQPIVIGGTSAVAPLWAGLLAVINQQLGHSVGYVNPLAYEKIALSGALHDITSGNNGAYSAKVGWDACTGLGSPDGLKLLDAFAPGK